MVQAVAAFRSSQGLPTGRSAYRGFGRPPKELEKRAVRILLEYFLVSHYFRLVSTSVSLDVEDIHIKFPQCAIKDNEFQ